MNNFCFKQMIEKIKYNKRKNNLISKKQQEIQKINCQQEKLSMKDLSVSWIQIIRSKLKRIIKDQNKRKTSSINPNKKIRYFMIPVRIKLILTQWKLGKDNFKAFKLCFFRNMISQENI